MNKNKQNLENMKKVGNFTKDAVEEFEENIIKQKDFLQRVDVDLNKNK